VRPGAAGQQQLPVLPPEDLSLYEEMGYDRFKVVERDLPTPVMVSRVRAYAERRYDGNLLDLVQPYAFQGTDGGDMWRYLPGKRRKAG